MAHTNSTENYGLPQWIGTDKPTFLGDFNTAFGVIDGALKDNADAATAAVATANSASAVASSANTNATTALSTANEAKADAASAVTTASTANSKATQAQTDAASALHASAGNSIENLAPAYDPTLTYNVGDLVTYIDAQNSGKMYKCIVAVNTPMEFNINYWDDVTTSEVYAQISSGTSIEDVVDMVSLYTEPTQVSEHAYAVGDYFVYDSKLYKATQVISVGGAITPNTNCVATSVSAEIESVKAGVAGADSDIAQLQTAVNGKSDKLTRRATITVTASDTWGTINTALWSALSSATFDDYLRLVFATPAGWFRAERITSTVHAIGGLTGSSNSGQMKDFTVHFNKEASAVVGQGLDATAGDFLTDTTVTPEIVGECYLYY